MSFITHFFFSSRRRHTRWPRDWSSDVCSSDLPGEVLLDAFELARDIREVDMRASPYDVSAYRGANGQFLTPIPIETNEGKRTYVAFQRQFTQRGNALRQRILDILAHPDLSGAHPVEGSPSNPTPHDEHAHAGHGGNPEDNP